MKRELKFILLIIVLISPTLVNGNNSDRVVRYYDNVEHVPTVRSYSIEGTNEPFFTPDAGTEDDPIIITLPSNEGARNASANGELSGNQTMVWYKVSLEQGSFARIELTPSNFDPVEQDIGFDVLTPNFDYLQGSFDDFAPVQAVEFPVENQGSFYIIVWGSGHFNDATGAPFMPGETIPFKVQVFEYPAGAGPAGANTTVLESVPKLKINNILNFLVNKSYVIDPTLGTYNVARLNQGTSSYPKAVASTVFGLLRAGDYMSHEGLIVDNLGAFPPPDETKLLPFFMTAYNLANDLLTTRGINIYDASLVTTNMTLAYNAADSVDLGTIDGSTPGKISFSLEDNTYLLMAMLEIQQILFNFLNNPLTPFINNDLIGNFTNTLYKITDSIVTEFWNGTYMFEEVFLDFTKDSVGTYVAGTARDFSSDYVKLESLALLAEVLDRANEAGASDYNSRIENIISFIHDNMMVKSVSYSSLQGMGVGVESITLSTLTKSTTADLLGNTYLASILNPVETRFRSFVNLTASDELASNILTLFTSSQTGLLYDKVNTTTQVFHKTTSILNIIQFATFMGRLAGTWKKQEGTYGKIVESISRSWSKRSIELQNKIENKMYDSSNKAFFARYDEDSGLLLADDGNVNENQFVANAMAMAQQIKIFPVNVQSLTQDEVMVNDISQIAIKISQLVLQGPWLWFDPSISFDFDLTVTISDFGYSETQKVDLFNVIFGGQGSVSTFFYEPTKRGEFKVVVTASKEGQLLLSQELKITALGEIHAEVASEISFATDEDSFTASFSLIDEHGLAVQNLQVNASLGEPLDKANRIAHLDATDRSDSSGEVNLVFDVSNFDKLFINRSKFPENQVPNFLTFNIFANVTNLGSNNLVISEGLMVIPVKVQLARTIVQISPTNLQITQGTTESFSFELNVLNQQLDPVVSAKVVYSLDGSNSTNVVTTDADGSATITIRDLELVNLAPPSANISFTITHDNYPTRSLSRRINVLENGIRIIANPVQYSIKGKTIFQSSISSLDVEVATEDLFGQSLTAMVFLRWSNPKVNEYVDVTNEGERIAPHTFTLDPTNLPAGTYTLIISAWREGIVSRQDPTTVTRTIIITEPTFYDSIASAVLIYGAYIASKFLFIIVNFAKKKMGLLVECPYCKSDVDAKASNCSACGNTLKPSSKPADL